MSDLLAPLLLGLAASALGSMLGIGGGSLFVPLATLGLGVSFRNAVSASLAMIVASSVLSTRIYSGRGLVKYRLGVFMEWVTALGALAGSRAAIVVDERALKVVFSVVLASIAIRMIRGAGPRPGVLRLRSHLAVLGMFAAGAASGMLGIGGGVLKVPLMVLVLGVPVQEAVATSAFMLAITASTGLVGYVKAGLVDPRLSSMAVLGGLLGSQLGPRLSMRMRAGVLRRAFGVVMLAISARMLWSGVVGGG